MFKNLFFIKIHGFPQKIDLKAKNILIFTQQSTLNNNKFSIKIYAIANMFKNYKPRQPIKSTTCVS